MFTESKILVAGAAGLLGSKIVAAIINAGGYVIATDIDLELMRRKLQEIGLKINSSALVTFELDLTVESDSQKLFADNRGITGAVNATYPRNKTYGADFFDVTLASFNENLALHLGSAFSFSQQCAAYFKRHQSEFSLVNISSIYGVVAPKFSLYENTTMTMPVEYAAIKSAIIHLNKYVAAVVNDSKFRVNSVCPGGILDKQPVNFLEKYKEHTFGKGMLDVDDIIGTILFLLSSQSKFLNGQNIVVDDGFSL